MTLTWGGRSIAFEGADRSFSAPLSMPGYGIRLYRAGDADWGAGALACYGIGTTAQEALDALRVDIEKYRDRLTGALS